MQPRLQLLILFASIVLFLVVLELIRRRRLRQEYSLIWLFSAIVIFLLAFFKGSLRLIASFVQIDYAPSLIFVVGLALIVAIQLEQAVAISKLSRQNRELAQRLTMYKWQLDAMQDSEGSKHTTSTSKMILDEDGKHEEAKSISSRS